MGTDRRPRPTRTQTRKAPLEFCDDKTLVGGFSSAWLESSLSPEREQLGDVGYKETGDPYEIGFDVTHGGKDKKGHILAENGGISLSNSPARGYGDSDTDTTPRIETAEPLLPAQDSADNLSPSRQVSQGSAYGSIMDTKPSETEVDVERQAANIKARERVEILRGRVFRTRGIINEKRQDVRFLRGRLQDATDDLMRAIDKLMAMDKDGGLRSLTPLYGALQKAKDEFGPAEDAYDLLEIRLSHEEEELEAEENSFYVHNNTSLGCPPDAKLEKSLTPRATPYDSRAPSPTDLNPEPELVQQYLDKVSGAEILKEQLRELEDEQYRLSQELSFRKRHGLTLSKENRAFLDGFPQLRRELIESLENLEDDLHEARDRCIKEKLFGPSDYPYEPHDALIQEIYESIDEVREGRPLYAKCTKHLQDFTTKKDYMNTWLLEWMQESTVQILLLKGFIYFEYPQDGKGLHGDDWSDLALEFWDHDSAGEALNVTQRLSTMDALLGRSSMELEDWDFGQEPNSIPQSLRDIGIDLPHVERVPPEQGPSQRRRASH